MKKTLILLFVFILLVVSVNASISKIYISHDSGRTWEKSITDYAKEIYLNSNGDLYYYGAYYGGTYDRYIIKKVTDDKNLHNFFTGISNEFIPKGIDKVNGRLYIWGKGVSSDSLYYYDNTLGKWVGAGLTNRETSGIGYYGNYIAQTNLYNFFVISSTGIPPEQWGKSDSSGIMGGRMRTIGTVFYERGLDGSTTKITKGGGTIINLMNDLQKTGDFEVSACGTGEPLIWVVDNNYNIETGSLYKYYYEGGIWKKFNLKNYLGEKIKFIEANSCAVYLTNETSLRTYIAGSPKLIFDIKGQSNYNKFNALEVNGNNVAVAVSYTCVDNDRDGYSGEDLIVNGEVICKKDDCDDNDANIHPGAFESCNVIDDDCDGTIDEGCTCSPVSTPGSPNIQPCEKQQGVCTGTTKTCLSTGWTNCENVYNLISDYESIETKCSDGKDNDCDGLIDCSDSDCMQGGFCTCTPTTDCGTGKVCDGVCKPVCTTNGDCTNGKICETGICITPTTPASCSAAESTKCHELANCYLDGTECKTITSTTTCEILNNKDLDACENPVINCEIVDGKCVETELQVGNLGCTAGTETNPSYPQADGTCGTSADSSGECDNDNTCDSGDGELCGACNQCEGYGEGGCAIGAYCKMNEGCTTHDDSELKCEDVGFLESECTASGDVCVNEYYLTCNTPPCLSEGAIDINGEMCCIGKCSTGQVEFTATGNINVYSYGPCTPLETGTSEGKRLVYMNNQLQTEPAPCTIMPNKKVPFSSILGILIGLTIIILFYTLRKKH